VIRPLAALDALGRRLVSARLSPLAHTGSLAILSFAVACVSGVLLLFWYSASARTAWESLEAMGPASWLVRSLHRYSSDACMLFVALHALRHLAARRVAGAHRRAWVTGVLLLGALWLVGWLGYWLVWDEQGHRVALGTARVVDALPIFADSLTRSFLTDEAVNPLLFFVVFLAHLLLPVAVVAGLWLHVSRVSRAEIKPPAWLSVALGVTLLACSLAAPATSGPRARMTAPLRDFRLDAWYAAPLWLTDRLGGGTLWALLGAGAILGLWAPLLWRTRPAPAEVEARRCNGCARCRRDCPYAAITFVPREGDRRLVAQVEPTRCAGCGICAGSCDPGAIGVPEATARAQHRQLDAWLAEGPALVVIGCRSSAVGALVVSEESGRAPLLDDARVLLLPCSGDLHALTVERALRHGATGVLVVACAPGGCAFRGGDRLTDRRLSGALDPPLRRDRLDAGRVSFVELGPADRGALLREADRLRRGLPAPGRPPRALRPGAIALAGGVGALLVLASGVPYRAPGPVGPELVVSFKHAGRKADRCRPPTAGELEGAAPHMRPTQVCERRRPPVRLRVLIDGGVVWERAYYPRGLFGDGASVAIARIPVARGTHRVEVALGDTADPAEWSWRDGRILEFGDERRVVLFDRLKGWSWY
jgi:coenzyme F420-reducing hydrogenase delta subunit/Pyruvate/2-oxoacid:ferredoxin oxidoreductase delta subunit